MIIPPANQWPGWIKVSTVIGGVSIVVLLGNLATAVDTLDEWVPATRGFVYNMRAAAESSTQQSIASLNRIVQAVLIENLKITLRQLQDRDIRLTDLLAENPGDFTIRQDIASNKGEMNRVANQIGLASCELIKIDQPSRVCQ